ncbi:energy-coupling factor ABC transporter ATP-binding protein [Thalassobius sp. Cn5-15]|jgi:tungstate transport system ATP-binding protein|uniref:energy-coupling factor ABC transporter ATP-binding protein n=1 Tax=Thalassobius sp. Cn5-15 TaxID=2917763 RepID=UPI001EF2FA8F|nr:ATP-binding cassette domain-containing protein [Thalassobius sp. Cn5-15]MCG7494260.1 ATP-binding cassette domain-containing protein [Thalassobius sp. Cn5-15]
MVSATHSRILPLELSAATVKRRGRTLVGPIDLTLGRDGFTIVLGPNGAGKTSLLRLMHGLERPATGTVTWAADEDTSRAHQAYVFQHPTLMRRSVLDNVAYALTVHGTRRVEARDRAAAALTDVGLGDSLGKPAWVLSGGERQKLALARALIRHPQILFLDEPCASLDGGAIRDIEAILNRAHASGTRIVMITHDLGQARRLARDVLFIYKGRVHEAAPADTFFEGPATAEARAFVNGDILL